MDKWNEYHFHKAHKWVIVNILIQNSIPLHTKCDKYRIRSVLFIIQF